MGVKVCIVKSKCVSAFTWRRYGVTDDWRRGLPGTGLRERGFVAGWGRRVCVTGCYTEFVLFVVT